MSRSVSRDVSKWLAQPRRWCVLAAVFAALNTGRFGVAGEPPIVHLPATATIPPDGSVRLELDDHVVDADTPRGNLSWRVYYTLGAVRAVIEPGNVVVCTVLPGAEEETEPMVVLLSVHDGENVTDDSIELTVGTPPTGGRQLPGDCNQDAVLDISDAVCLLGHLFLGSPARLPCGGGTLADQGNVTLLDVNGSGQVDLSDGVYVLAFLFSGGPAPSLGRSCVEIAGCPEVCGSSPATDDHDGDGIDDEAEFFAGTSKHYPDSDGDGVLDGSDPNPGTPRHRWSQPFVEGLDEDARSAYDAGHFLHLYYIFYRGQFLGDADRDGIEDAEELVSGGDGYETDPGSADSDRDGLTDGGEVTTTQSDPTASDSESDEDGDGLSLLAEADAGTNANVGDSDGDGLVDGEELNSDGRSDTILTNLQDSSGAQPVTAVDFTSQDVDPFYELGKKTVYAFVPVSAYAIEYVVEATVTLSGQAYNDPTAGSSYPSGVLLDVGAGFGPFSPEFLDWSKPVIRIDNYARSSSGVCLGEDWIGQSFKVLKDTSIRGFAIYMDIFTAGNYKYGLQDASGQWLSGFPRTSTLATTAGATLVSFSFPSTSLTKGTEYRLALGEATDLDNSNDVPLGVCELVDNPYPYGRFLVGASHGSTGSWNTGAPYQNDDLVFHVFRDFDSSETTYDLSGEFNEYLATHVDADDGSADGYVRVPIDVYSATVGTVGFSSVDIEVAILTTDPQDTDTDGDNLYDGWDDTDGDQIYDDGETAGERQHATNPTNPDTDGDGEGLDDFEEVTTWYDITLPTGIDSVHIADPLRPDLLVETDAMSGYSPTDAMMFETQKAYQDLGFTLRYKIDSTSLGAATVNNSNAKSLQSSNDNATYGAYVHLIFARDHSDSSLRGTTVYELPNASNPAASHPDPNHPDPKYSGVFIFRERINNQHTQDQQNRGITLDLLTARTIIHELGHALGCNHESTTGGFDYENVMASSGALNTLDRLETNVLGPDGTGPRFSAAGALQIDLSFKTSADTSVNPSDRGFDCGLSNSPIAPGYRRVLKSDAYSRTLRYGWEVGAAPTQASENGGSDTNAKRDIVEGTNGSDVRFQLGGLGRYKVNVLVGLGKGRSTNLSGDIRVGGKLLGTTSTNHEWAWLNAPQDHYELGLNAPSYAEPFPDGTIVIDFTDDVGSNYEPSPIEYIRMLKRMP